MEVLASAVGPLHPLKEKERDYKKLVNVILEDDKSQDLQSVSLTARRANDLVPDPRTRTVNGVVLVQNMASSRYRTS